MSEHTKQPNSPYRPKHLRIIGRVWTVTYKDRVEIEDGEALGICDVDNLKIVIKNGQPTDGERETLLHEILHALWSTFALGDTSKEERAVTCMSAGIYAVMIDNPTLAKYLWRA